MIQLDFSVRRDSFLMEVKAETDAQVTALFGPSGSGKTTCLHAVAGILRPEEGRVRLADQVYYDSAHHINVRPERRRVGMVFQDDRLFPHLDVKGNLLFGQRNVPVAQRRINLDEAVDLLDLGPLLKRRIGRISGGEARRVALGRALLMSPEFLLLDEPLTGLDQFLRDRILAYLIRLKRRFSLGMLYVSHSVSDILALADYVVVGDSQMQARGLRLSRFERTGTPRRLLPDLVRGASESPLETVLFGRVTKVAPEEGFALCETGRMSIYIPCDDRQGVRFLPGIEVFVTIAAQDLLLARGSQAPETSARNRWEGIVTDLHDLGAAFVAGVDVGERILVEITPAAIRALNLTTGAKVYILSKVRNLRVSAVGAGLGDSARGT
jgi:molybdate transport system ATP-binding protein